MSELLFYSFGLICFVCIVFFLCLYLGQHFPENNIYLEYMWAPWLSKLNTNHNARIRTTEHVWHAYTQLGPIKLGEPPFLLKCLYQAWKVSMTYMCVDGIEFAYASMIFRVDIVTITVLYFGFHVISTLDMFIIHEGLIQKIHINNIVNCSINQIRIIPIIHNSRKKKIHYAKFSLWMYPVKA